MKQYNIFMKIKGQAGIEEAPNKYNPVSAENIKEVLLTLAPQLPFQDKKENGRDISLDLSIIGIRVEEADTNKCKNCGADASYTDHTCPYKKYINHDKTLCNCCSYCTYLCCQYI